MSMDNDFVSHSEESLAPYRVLGWTLLIPAIFFLALTVLLIGNSLFFTVINFFGDFCWDPHKTGDCLDPFRDGFLAVVLKPSFLAIVSLGVFLGIMSFFFLNKGYAKSKIGGKSLKIVLITVVLAAVIAYFLT